MKRANNIIEEVNKTSQMMDIAAGKVKQSLEIVKQKVIAIIKSNEAKIRGAMVRPEQ